MIEQLLKILNKRKNEININGSELDKKKIQNIEQFLNVPNCFFQVDEDVAISMLLFLGIPNDKVENVYFALLSPDNYKNDDVYNLIDLNELEKEK